MPTRAYAPDGSRVVFKWFDAPYDLAEFQQRQAQLEALRAAGYPLPAQFTPIEVPGALVVSQEFISTGRVQDRIADSVVDDVLRLNALQQDAAPDGQGWAAFLTATLSDGGRGYLCRSNTGLR
ncbi:MAG: hypothetical protein ACYDB7_09365 [Mycobacteriales bacterium]